MWESILKTVAPVLGTAIGGPFGGMASKFLIEKLGGNTDTSEDEMHTMIETANPATLLKLKKLDADFKLQMRTIGLKEKDLIIKDRADARTMGVQTTLAPQMLISTIFVLAFSIILYTVFTGVIELSEQQKIITTYLLGILSAGMIQIMNFWFGSSSGSKEKDTPKL